MLRWDDAPIPAPRGILSFFSDQEEPELRMPGNVLVTFTLKALAGQPTAHFVPRNGSGDSTSGFRDECEHFPPEPQFAAGACAFHSANSL